MTASSSPATFGASPLPFRSMTEVTYSSGGWRLPRTGDECERVLRAAAGSQITSELSSFLAGFLGVAGGVWTAPRRTVLRKILARGGVGATPAVLRAVASTPRAEVIDDAVDVLAEAAVRDERVVGALAGLLLPVSSIAKVDREPLVGDEPAVRATIARALGRTSAPRTRDVRFRALASALLDPSPEVRDAAIQSLGSCGDPVALQLLEQRRPKEPERFLVDAIDDALAELRGE